MVRWHRLLPFVSLAGALLLALPVEAARLQDWRFDPQENRLIFTTDDSIQPTAQLISNPTRLVIDMPGTTLSRPESMVMDGTIKEIRVSAHDAETTRLVVEYNPGYTVDPNQVQVRGESPSQWSVQLPEAIAVDNDTIDSNPTAAATAEIASAEATTTAAQQGQNAVSNRPVQGASTRIQGVTTTADGFFIRTLGDSLQLDTNLTVDRFEEDGQRYIALDFDQASIALGLTAAGLPNNRYSISSWRAEQVSANPARVRIVLALGEESPDWEIMASEEGVVILPMDVSISDVPDTEPLVPSEATAIASAERQPPSTRQIDTDELPTLPNGRFTVVLDPGHGGRDPGAVGINGLQEKQVVNDITPQVAEILRAQGADVVLTRDRDMEIDLAPRVQIAERVNASIFVSIHANAISMSRPDVNGLETFYASASGQRLANTVHSTVLNEMGMRDRRVRSARFYVIRQTSMPAILIETGFVTGAEDYPNLADPVWRQRMATAIARGILLHLQRGI